MEQAGQRVVIVGGGIAGLSTAWYLQRQATQPLSITILEQSGRVGGKLRTDMVRLPDSDEPLVIEGGPDSFIIQKPWALELCRELGLEQELIATQPAKHNVYVLHRRKPLPMPEGVMLVVPTDLKPFALTPLISWRGKLRMALDLVLPRRSDDFDETLAGFIKRRLGAEALDKIAEPLMAGIYNAESERQSLLATFPRLREIEKRYGSLIKGMRAARKQAPKSNQPTSPFRSLRGGIETLVKALVSQLTATIRTSTAVIALTPQADGAFLLALDDGTSLEADAVVLATPAPVASMLVAPWNADLSRGLRQIRYVSTGTVTLAYRKADLRLPIEGYGLVIPHSEGTQINACTISSRKFAHRAPDEYVLMRAFVGGSRNPDLLHRDDSTLIDVVRTEFRALLGVAAEPVWSGVYRWPSANPQYDVNHLERMDRLDQRCPAGLYLTGSAYRGVGIPDCVHQGQQTAAKVLEEITKHPMAPAMASS